LKKKLEDCLNQHICGFFPLLICIGLSLAQHFYQARVAAMEKGHPAYRFKMNIQRHV
jgi:hypothetical protein